MTSISDWLILIGILLVVILVVVVVLKLSGKAIRNAPGFFSAIIQKMTGHNSESAGKVITGILIGIIVTGVISNFDESGSIQQAWGLVVLGTCVVIGLFWQWILLVRDAEKLSNKEIPFRYLASTITCVLLLLGVLMRGIFLIYYDDRANYELSFLIRDITNAFIFSLIFLLKSYFAALVTMFGVALAVFFFLEYRTISPVAVLEPILEQIVALAPSSIQDIYVAAFGVYAVGVSFKDTFA
jgi:hypothetical protein